MDRGPWHRVPDQIVKNSNYTLLFKKLSPIYSDYLNFARIFTRIAKVCITVILLIRHGQDGASGLVINRPLNVKLSTVLPEIKELEQRNENLYLGGPVEPGREIESKDSWL